MSEGENPTEKAYADASPFQPKPKPPLLHRAVPVSQELPSYRSSSARRDVLAGVTVAALALPSAMAAAALALLVGACFLAARALRLGWLADYFSRPVLIG